MPRIVVAGLQKVQAEPEKARATHPGSESGLRGAAMTEWYFVWVEGLRGPVPQKWSSDGLWGQVGRQDVIVRFTLDDAEAHLPLDELARRHPIPDGR
jgi:hypothetical protein